MCFSSPSLCVGVQPSKAGMNVVSTTVTRVDDDTGIDTYARPDPLIDHSGPSNRAVQPGLVNLRIVILHSPVRDAGMRLTPGYG